MALVRDAGNNLMIRLILILFLLYIMTREDVRERTLSIVWILPFGLGGLILSLLSEERELFSSVFHTFYNRSSKPQF